MNTTTTTLDSSTTTHAEASTTAASRVNGVDVAALQNIITNIKANPGLAKSTWRNRNRWIEGALNQSSIQGFSCGGTEDTSRVRPFVFENDEPPLLLGENRAPNPVEWVLHGLAGCVTTTLVYYAGVLGIELDSVETEFEGDIDLRGLLGVSNQVPSGYQAIRIRFKIEGKSVTDEQRTQLIELAQKHSPVFGTVTSPVPVSVELAR